MIYITGDTHAGFKHRFNMDNFPEQREMTKDDYVIICGDFGGNRNLRMKKRWKKAETTCESMIILWILLLHIVVLVVRSCYWEALCISRIERRIIWSL